MHRIGVISDTHGLLRPEVAEALGGCGAILHGGDINRREILDELERIAPVSAVRGNNDREWAEYLPESLTVCLFGITFFMIHNRGKISGETAEDVARADIVVYGHTHRYEETYERAAEAAGGRKLWLNPGSCGPRRFSQPITMALLEVGENGAYSVRKLEISRSGGLIGGTDKENETAGTRAEIPADIRDRIPMIMKDMDRGRQIRQIARRAGISTELAEQICRLYVTHPGVDVDGILRRMGL